MICLLLILLNLSFIWGNSLLPAKQSAQVSSDFLDRLEEMIGVDIPQGSHLIRKLAHFSEFTCLGLLFAWLFRIFRQKGFHSIAMPLLFSLLAALTDETLQLQVPGRGPGIMDVWLDTSGALAGILILLLIFKAWRKKTST